MSEVQIYPYYKETLIWAPGLKAKGVFSGSVLAQPATTKISWTICLYKQQKFSSGGWKSKIRCQHGQVLVRLSSGLQAANFLYPHMADSKGQKQALSHHTYKGTNPIHKGSTLMISPNPNTCQRLHLLIISLGVGIEFQYMNLGSRGTRTFSP